MTNNRGKNKMYLGLGDLLEELLKAGDIVRDEVVLAVVALALRPLLLLALALGRALRGGGLLLFGLLLLLRRLHDWSENATEQDAHNKA